MKKIALIILLTIFSFTSIIISYASENEQTSLKEKYTQDELDYFYEIAFGSEYGNKTNVIHKWGKSEIKISIIGNPVEEYIEKLNEIANELTDLTGISFEIVDKSSDIKIYFINHSDFKTYIDNKNIAENSWGYVYIWWDGGNEIYKGNIYIATDKGTIESQSHVIREELTQSLGLVNDSWEYCSSVFYQEGRVQDYSNIDKAIIQLLYESDIKSGMTKSQIQKLFK